MFGMFGGFGMGGGRFEAHYRCYPVTFIDKPEAERGDKIFMPPSALDRLGEQGFPPRFLIPRRDNVVYLLPNYSSEISFVFNHHIFHRSSHQTHLSFLQPNSILSNLCSSK